MSLDYKSSLHQIDSINKALNTVQFIIWFELKTNKHDKDNENVQ